MAKAPGFLLGFSTKTLLATIYTPSAHELKFKEATADKVSFEAKIAAPKKYAKMQLNISVPSGPIIDGATIVVPAVDESRIDVSSRSVRVESTFVDGHLVKLTYGPVIKVKTIELD